MKISIQSGKVAIALAMLFLVLVGPVLGDNCNPQIGGQTDSGIVSYPSIVEASGLAASRKNSNVIYTHNDSGNSAKVYAINEEGQHLCTYTIGTWGARDWEDMAVGPGPSDGQNYIYVGDIGDNNAVHATSFILRMLEPSVSSTQASTYATISSYDVITYVYPDGPRDAETLMVDPLTKDIYIVSKRESQVKVYRLPYPQSTTSTITAQQVASPQVWNWITAGDISPSGYEILIKNASIMYHWCRLPGETIGEAMSTTPVTMPYAQEMQGEALCWRADGKGYYTLSEGSSQHLYYYPDITPTEEPPPGSTNEPPPDGEGGSTNEPPPGGEGGSTNEPPPEEEGGSTNEPPAEEDDYNKHDYDGDGKADLAVFTGKNDQWCLLQSSSNVMNVQTWGDKKAIPVPGDYDGDGSADLATCNPKNFVWKMYLCAEDIVNLQFGFKSVTPAPADYDGDGVTDIAVFHPKSGTWYLMMSTAGFQTRQWGWSKTTPVPADYDGDGKDDAAVYFPNTGTWYILNSSGGSTMVQWGWSKALPVPADYDGDGKADLAVYDAKTGKWYLNQSNGEILTIQFGFSKTTPVPADYDGDGKADVAVYHQKSGSWYVTQSTDGFITQKFGNKSTEPVTSDPAIWLNH